jgi:shikimate dehydrogenase
VDGLGINGRTRIAGLVGWPIDRSLSPAMHNAAYEELGLNWVYLPFPAPDTGALLAITDAARRIPCVGFNVTMPHKQAMLDLCDEVATLARMAGAVNTVHCVEGRLIGYNTDGRGLLESLAADLDFDPAGASVAIIGAGGGAGAAATAFILGKAARLTIVNRNVLHAETVLARVEHALRDMEVAACALDDGAAEAVRSADIVVNATPVGMREGDPSPIPAEWLRSGQVVYDMVYHRPSTRFVEDAQAAGARGATGLGMLVCQGALAIDIWAGGERAQRETPRDVMRAAAVAVLEAEGAEAGETP